MKSDIASKPDLECRRIDLFTRYAEARQNLAGVVVQIEEPVHDHAGVELAFAGRRIKFGDAFDLLGDGDVEGAAFLARLGGAGGQQ